VVIVIVVHPVAVVHGGAPNRPRVLSSYFWNAYFTPVLHYRDNNSALVHLTWTVSEAVASSSTYRTCHVRGIRNVSRFGTNRV
jgi:hypothetical protein